VKIGRLATASIAFLLFFGPILAYASGRRGAPVENRPATDFSELSVSWDGFSTLSKFIGDRIPLRSRAIKSDGWIDQHIFHEDPAFGGGAVPRIIHGKDGYLFLNDDFEMACQSADAVSQLVTSIGKLVDVINQSGRQAIYTVAPNKTTLHSDLLPDDQGSLDCLKQYSDGLWQGLSAANIDGYVDLKSALSSAMQKTREPLYLRKDSHWDSAGSAAAAKAVIDELQPGLWDDAALQYKGQIDYTGDLTYLEGNPVVDQTPLYEVVRPEITAGTPEIWDAEDMTHVYRRYTNTGPAGSLITAKTVIMVDSFGVEAMARIIPYFADITFVHFDSLSPEALIAEFNQADTVWIMCVERAIGYRFSDPPVEFFYPYGTQEFLDTLDSQLESKGAK
jgi:hypothetical protein